jgi:UDP-glucose:(glucosyl)LPS alpha-1,2-glucosyltransferase
MLMSNIDLAERNETNVNSKGGTELLQDRLYDGVVPRELLEQFQIVFSRVRDLDHNRFRIFYAHDLPGDPEAEFLKDGGWKKFHKLVFVSHWQMQAYINHYSIPWSHCEVIENSIIPLDPDFDKSPYEPIRICYTSTPHRGLHILYAAFDALSRKHENIVLDVFSSFKLYGWEERDEQHRELFNLLDAHPKVQNHGTVSNEKIRKYLEDNASIFAYPSVWPETSCLCLIEAMSAGLMCVHNDYAALPETSGGLTYMYQLDEDDNRHATKLYHVLDGAIENIVSPEVLAQRKFAKIYADHKYNWHNKAHMWTGLLQNIIAQNPDKALPGKVFTYNV